MSSARLQTAPQNRASVGHREVKERSSRTAQLLCFTHRGSHMTAFEKGSTTPAEGALYISPVRRGLLGEKKKNKLTFCSTRWNQHFFFMCTQTLQGLKKDGQNMATTLRSTYTQGIDIPSSLWLVDKLSLCNFEAGNISLWFLSVVCLFFPRC